MIRLLANHPTDVYFVRMGLAALRQLSQGSNDSTYLCQYTAEEGMPVILDIIRANFENIAFSNFARILYYTSQAILRQEHRRILLWIKRFDAG